MAERLGSAVLELRTDDAKFTKGVKRAKGAAKGLDKGLVSAGRSARKLGTNLSKLGRKVSALGKSLFTMRNAAVLAAGVVGLGLLIKRSLDTADKIGKMADAIGITTTALQEYRFAAGLSGISTEALDKGFLNATKNIGELGRSSSELSTALKDLDPTLLANVRAADSVAEAIDLAFVAMAGYEKQAKRVAVANVIFGRSGKLMTNIVRDGTDAFRAMIAEARTLGLIIPEVLIRNAEEANDALSRMFQVIDIATTTTLLTFAPLISDIGAAFLETIPAIKGFTESILIFFDRFEAVSLERLRQELMDTEEELRGLQQPWMKAFIDEEVIVALQFRIEAITRAMAALNEEVRKNKEEGLKIDIFPPGPPPPDQAEFEAAMRKRIELERRAQRVIRATRTAQELFNETMVELGELLDLRKIDWDTYKRAVGEAQDTLKDAQDQGIETFDELEDAGKQAFESLTDSLEDFARTGKFEWRDLARVALSAIRDILNAQISAGATARGGIFQSLLGSIFGAFTGGFGGGATAGTSLSIGAFPSFAHGGAFPVGGTGGIDSQLVQFMATPGETVTVTPEGGGLGSTFIIDARGADRDGMRELRVLIERLDGSIEPRAVQAMVDLHGRSLNIFGN